ncbi:hypothetical protein CRI94_12140 [Longibacter salinarum]|uniref:Uncharacterized protein n=1 Tax=Longibacter salinarum TaxID=1850348 RepID=A0A2A8CVM8_9BACT|nr:hypothetical protein [Longibacter salinarum]PEN12765.1 hypothetical protein CRI94_12140 [Longibacter salinarum]
MSAPTPTLPRSPAASSAAAFLPQHAGVLKDRPRHDSAASNRWTASAPGSDASSPASASPDTVAGTVATRDCLKRWLKKQVRAADVRWLTSIAASIANGARDARVLPAFTNVPKRTGTAPLDLGASDLSHARSLNPDWDPSDWTVDQAARVLILLSLPTDDRTDYLRRLRLLHRTADEREAVALHSARPLLPFVDDALPTSR